MESTSISTGMPPCRARTAANASATPPAASDVVVLDEGGVGQAHAVVGAAAAAHGVLLEGAQPGHRLARVAHDAAGAGERIGPTPRQGGDAGEVAQQVQRRALGREQGAGRRRHAGDDLAGRDPLAVGGEVLDIGRGVAAHGVDGGGGDGEAGDDAVAAAGERADAALVGGHGGRRRHVDAAHQVLGDGHPHEGGDGIGIEPGGRAGGAGCRRPAGGTSADDLDAAVVAEAGAEVAAATRRSSSGKSERRWQPRLSVRTVAAATTADATVSTFVASHEDRDGSPSPLILPARSSSTLAAAASDASSRTTPT